MTEPWMPSDEKIGGVWWEAFGENPFTGDPMCLHPEPIRALIREGVKKAVATERELGYCELAGTVTREVEKAVEEVKADWENAIQHERMLFANDPHYATDAVVFALNQKHARELERAKLEAKIEAWTETGCYYNDEPDARCDPSPGDEAFCYRCRKIVELADALAALDKEES